MDRPSLTLLVAFVAVAVVLAGVWAVARFGERAALHPPSPRTIRRLGLLAAGFGVLMLVAAALRAATGDLVWSALHLLQAAAAVAMGLGLAREHRPTR